MFKRFVSYFGVSVPPQKRKKIGAGSTTIRFVLTGKIPSKKNNTMAVTIRKEAREYLNKVSNGGMVSLKEAQLAVGRTHSKVRGNKEYQYWVKEQKPILLKQMHTWVERLGEKGLIFPLDKAAMSIRFYFDNKYHIDTVNKSQSVQDLLVDCKILKDDTYNVLNPIHQESDCYKDEITSTICFISLSFKL